MMSRSAWSSVTLLVTVLALAGCGDSPSAPDRAVTPSLRPAAGAEVSRGRAQQSFSDILARSPCDGEFFNVTIVVDYQWHITKRHIASPKSYEWMHTQHTRLSIDGVGTTSGARYIGRGTANTTQVFAALDDPDRDNEGGAFTFTTVVRIQNVVQGRADNDVSVVHARWTINSNGQVSVNLLNVEFDCRG